MKTRNQDFLLGLAAILFLALFLVTLLVLVPSLRAPETRTVVIHFRHEDGLAPIKPGSLVLLSGAIEVGHVSKVEVRETEIESPRGRHRRTIVVATAEINRDIPLYGNCEVRTDMPLIGGSGTVVINNVGTPDVPLPAGPIEGLPPQGMAAFSALSRRLTAEGGLVDRLDRMLDPDAEGSLLNKIMLSLADINAMTAELRVQLSSAEQQTLLAKVHLVMDHLNAVTSEVREQMQAGTGTSLLAKLHVALDQVQGGLREVQAILADSRAPLHNTLTSIEHTAQVVDQDLVGRLRVEFDPARPDSLLGKIHASLEHLQGALSDLQVVSDTGKRLVVLNRPQIERILANLRDTSEELALASREIHLNPARLIWGPGKPQESRLGLFSAARDFAQAATYLDEAAARLQAILAVGSGERLEPDSQEELRAIQEVLRSAFDRFQRAEAFFWDQMK